MNKILLIIISGYPLINISAQGTWTQKADFGGTARFVAAAFSIGTKGYIGTGRDLAGPGFTKDFWEWDQASDTWAQKADLPAAEKMAAAGFSIGNKGYITTGWDINLVFTQDLWEYDPAGNAWTQKADFPGPGRYRATAFSIGTKGYLSTGYDGSTYFKDFWEWDQATDTWSQKTDFPGVARLSPVSFSIGAKGYIGTGGDGNFTANYDDFYEWDQATDTWTQKASFPGAPRMGASGFSITCKGYAGTGVGSGGTAYSDFYEYDPSTDTWTQQSDYSGGADAQGVGFSIGDKGYIGTGQSMTNEFYEFAPDSLCVLSTIAVSANDTTLCEKFCTDFFDQSTNNPVSWLWIFEGGTPSTSDVQNPVNICYNDSGTYDVTLVTTDVDGNSDTLLLSEFITVYGTPSTPTITQNGDTLTSSTAFSYQWQFNTVDIPGATDQFYVADQSGLYVVIVGDENGCINSANIKVVFTGVEDLSDVSLISVYPNPSNGIFTLDMNLNNHAETVTIELYNSIGQLVLKEKTTSVKGVVRHKIHLDDDSSAGIYFVRVLAEDELLMKQLIIQK